MCDLISNGETLAYKDYDFLISVLKNYPRGYKNALIF